MPDGTHKSMLKRLQADNNPNLFFLSYTGQLAVKDMMVVPKHFFTPDIVIKRLPLTVKAKRSGWIGCQIDLTKIPASGKVFLIENSNIISPEAVRQQFNKTLFLRDQAKQARGWTLEIMRCVDAINKETFSIDEMYSFEKNLKRKYPNNSFIKDKIRQQMQILRDKGILDFSSRGRYRKIKDSEGVKS